MKWPELGFQIPCRSLQFLENVAILFHRPHKYQITKTHRVASQKTIHEDEGSTFRDHVIAKSSKLPLLRCTCDVYIYTIPESQSNYLSLI